MKKKNLIHNRNISSSADLLIQNKPVVIEPLRYYYNCNVGRPMRIHDDVEPSSSKKKFNMREAALAGLLCGFAGAFALQFSSISAKQARFNDALALEQSRQEPTLDQTLTAYQLASSQHQANRNFGNGF
jgi:hypothetical protein